MYRQSVNNIYLIEVLIQLTDKGAENRQKVIEVVLNAIAFYREKTIRPELLEFLKEMNVSSYLEYVQHPKKAAELLAEYLDFSDRPEGVFDFEERFGKVRAEDLQQISRKAFHSESLLVGYLGSDVQSEKIDPTFGLPIRLFEDIELYERWGAALAGKEKMQGDFEIQLPDIDLEFRKLPLSGETKQARRLSKTSPGVEVALEENHLYPTGALILDMQFPKMSAEDSVLTSIFVQCFDEHFKSELSYFYGLGLMDSLYFSSSSLRMILKGYSKASLGVFSYLMECMQSFWPSEQGFQMAVAKMRSAIFSRQQEFTGKIAMRQFSDEMNALRTDDKTSLEILDRIEFSSLKSWEVLFKRNSNLVAVFSGDFDEGTTQSCVEAYRGFFQKHLTEAQMSEREVATLDLNQLQNSWVKLSETKEDKAYGVIRGLQGPDIMSADFPIALLMMNFISSEVFQLNRTERELGYIQGAGISPHGKTSIIEFFGQTTGDENLICLVQGWNDVIESISSLSVPSEKLQNTLRGMLRSRELLPISFVDSAGRAFSLFRETKNPLFFEKITKDLRSVDLSSSASVEKVYKAVDQIVPLRKAKTLQVLAAKELPSAEILKAIGQ